MAVNKLSRISNASSISRRRIAITNRACQEQWPILLRSQVLWTVSWLQKDRFFLFSLSFSSLSPSPSPLAPFTGKQGGRARDRATRRGDAFRRETNKAETVRSIENFTSRLHAAGLSHWLPFPSIHPSIEGKGRREMVVGFFPNDYAKWKQPFLHCLLVPFPIENDRSRRDFFYFSGNLLSSADESRILQWNGGNEFICNSCGIIIIIIIIASIWLEILIGIDSFLFSNG